jgi:hypothetical protein
MPWNNKKPACTAAGVLSGICVRLGQDPSPMGMAMMVMPGDGCHKSKV